jgi:D-3-phosphoglycerate dehydrogenase
LLRDREIKKLFTNPNKQGFILDEDVLGNSSIEVINTCSTGTNHIDIAYCDANNIEIWSLTRDMKLIMDLPSTSELAFGLLCNLFRNINAGFADVKDGGWNYEPFMGKQLKGSSIGILGFGRLGQIMHKFCDAFGMNVYIYDPYKGFFDLDGLLRNSDAISLHVHVTDETRNMVDADFLSKMKNGSYLINTSRGELVDEEAIISALKSGHLAGYGTDVIRDEFGDRAQSELVKFSRMSDKVVITPHVGGMTWEGQSKAYKWAITKFKENSNDGN